MSKDEAKMIIVDGPVKKALASKGCKGMEMQFKNLKIVENDNFKICSSSDYNYIFNKKTGFFVRFGETKKDDPDYGPAPEIADIEITTSCSGIPNKFGKKSPCQF